MFEWCVYFLFLVVFFCFVKFMKDIIIFKFFNYKWVLSEIWIRIGLEIKFVVWYDNDMIVLFRVKIY